MNIKKTLAFIALSLLLWQCTPNTSTSSPKPFESRGVTYESFSKLTSSLDSLPGVLKRSWGLWQNEKWETLESYYEKNNYNSEYPPAQGFISVDTIVLKDDTRIDRYGSLWGTFVAPIGTPFGERSLPISSKSRVYYQFEVVKDIPNVLEGPAIPWFSMPGKGTQYMMPMNMKKLISEGYLIVLDSIVPKGVVDKYND